MVGGGVSVAGRLNGWVCAKGTQLAGGGKGNTWGEGGGGSGSGKVDGGGWGWGVWMGR